MSNMKPSDYERMQKLAREMAKERLARERAAKRIAERDSASDSSAPAAKSKVAAKSNAPSDRTQVIRKEDLQRRSNSGKARSNSANTAKSTASSRSNGAVKASRKTPQAKRNPAPRNRFDDISSFEQAFIGGNEANSEEPKKNLGHGKKNSKKNGNKKGMKKKMSKRALSRQASAEMALRNRKPAKPGSLRSKFYEFCDNHPGIGAFLADLNPKNWVDPNGNPLTKKRKVVKFGVRSCVTVFAACFLYATAVIVTAPHIDPANIYDAISTDSIVYDDNDKEVDTVSSGVKRTIVTYDEIPKDMANAIVALEDKTFWKHHGFNWKRMIGAVLQSFTGGGGISGTSTLTQQLARNVYLPDIMSQRSLRRKIIEMYYAARIEFSLSKEDIITAYLNSIYYGYGNYGIEAASECYFSKEVKDLTLVECATLASMPQSPDIYALIKDVATTDKTSDMTKITVGDAEYYANDIAKSRRQTCLALMKDQGYITEKQYNKNKDKDLVDYIKPTISSGSDNATTYFKDYMADEIIQDLQTEYNMDEDTAQKMVYSGGLKIYSTMDSEAQEVMNDAFSTDSYFPSVWNNSTDSNGNVVTDSGSITLYKYSNLVNSKGNMILKKSEFVENSDGSLTLKAGKRLNFYETTVDSGTDYSIELKPSYTTEDGEFYIYATGYINIPQANKTLDSEGNLTIDAEYIQNNPDMIKKSGSKWVIKKAAITMAEKTIQPQGAMVITEVGTGEIKAMIGGRGIKGSALYNRALSERQPGSSIKPLAVYGAALQKSYDYLQKDETYEYTDYGNDTQGTKYYGDYMTAGSTIVDEKLTFEGRTWPTNSYGGYKGKISMRRAMQLSSNVCAVKIWLQVGAEYSADLVEKFGITTLNREGDNSDENAAALALGGLSSGVKPLEMAQAYAAIANGGVRQSSISYRKVLDRNGNLLLTSQSESTKVLDEGVAFILADMMKSVVTKGTGTAAAVSGVQAGGKTGTTSNNYDIWFDGFTPKYAAALWIGTDYNIQLTSDSSGAAALWGRIMNKISAAKEGTYPSQPSDVIKQNGEYYIEGTEKNSGASYNSNESSKKKEDAEEENTEEQEKNTTDSSNDKNSTGGGSNSGGNSGGGNSGGGSSGGGSSGGGSSGGGSSGGGSSGGGDSGGGSSGGGDSGGGSSGGSDSGGGYSGDTDSNNAA